MKSSLFLIILSSSDVASDISLVQGNTVPLAGSRPLGRSSHRPRVGSGCFAQWVLAGAVGGEGQGKMFAEAHLSKGGSLPATLPLCVCRSLARCVSKLFAR